MSISEIIARQQLVERALDVREVQEAQARKAEEIKIDGIIKQYLARLDYNPLAKLYSAVACHLTGRKIFVRLRAPYLKDCRGVMAPCGNGEAVIDINQNRTQTQQYKTLLHEIAHVRHHFIDIDTGTVLKTPGSVDLDWGNYEMPVSQNREAEAWEQADKWDRWASDPVRLSEVGYHAGDPAIEVYKLHVLSKIEVYY